MSFTVKGKLVKVLDEVSGTSARGEWKKQDFVIETEGQYPKTICFTLFNDKVQLIQPFTVGMPLEVSFQVESREYQGRYFHNVNAWRVQPLQVNAAPQASDMAMPVSSATAPQGNTEANEDLPF